MKMRSIRIVATLALVAGLVVLAGCVRKPLPNGWRVDIAPTTGTTSSGAGATQQLTKIIDPAGATEAKVDVTMGAGEMSIGSADTSALAELSFKYRDPSWAPEVGYVVNGTTGRLVISQPDISVGPGYHPYSWDIALGKGIPIDLTTHLGAGTSTVDLKDLDIRTLTMRLGVGETTVDLTGPRTEDLKGDMQAGVGQLTVRLPQDVGVRVVPTNKGIGSIEADGFKVDGGAYVNDAYGTSPVNIELTISRGIGEIRLELQ